MIEPRRFEIAVAGVGLVSAMLTGPADAHVCFVLAHGAGSGMHHTFLAAMADGLTNRGIATLRYQFPYVEQKLGRPDSPRTAHATVRAAVAEAARQMPEAVLFAGGKSYGARMTSQAQAIEPLLGVGGLALLGFPLHASGALAVVRAKHLFEVAVPILLVSGTRDSLADLSLLRPLVGQLGSGVTLKIIDGADHAFHVLLSAGRTDLKALTEVLDSLASWFEVTARPG